MALLEADRSKTAFWGAQNIMGMVCGIIWAQKRSVILPKTNGQSIDKSAFRQMLH